MKKETRVGKAWKRHYLSYDPWWYEKWSIQDFINILLREGTIKNIQTPKQRTKWKRKWRRKFRAYDLARAIGGRK